MKLLHKIDRYLTRLTANTPGLVYSLARRVRLIFDKPWIKWNAFRNRPFTLIYQQGRVASTSVYEALAKLDNVAPIYHVHTISGSRAQTLIDEARRKNSAPSRNYFVGKLLSDELEKLQANKTDRNFKPWRIVTIFRDPVSVMISLYFMNKGDIPAPDSREAREKAVNDLTSIFERDDPSNWSICTWFDEVFVDETGVDVYQHPFDQQAGYQLIETELFRILLLRFEDLGDVFSDAVSKWLDIDAQTVGLDHVNTHRNKKHDGLQSYVKNNLTLSEQACARIYDTRLVQHFYSQELIEKLKRKWTRT